MRSFTRLGIVLIVLVLFLLLAGIASIFFFQARFDFFADEPAPVIRTATAAQVAEFGQKAGITFPPSARALAWREQRGWLDDALWLHVSMPAADLDDFLRNSPFRGQTLPTNSREPTTHFEMLITTPPTRHRVGQQFLPDAKSLNILVDESDDRTVQVYLQWHET